MTWEHTAWISIAHFTYSLLGITSQKLQFGPLTLANVSHSSKSKLWLMLEMPSNVLQRGGAGLLLYHLLRHEKVKASGGGSSLVMFASEAYAQTISRWRKFWFRMSAEKFCTKFRVFVFVVRIKEKSLCSPWKTDYFSCTPLLYSASASLNAVSSSFYALN